MLPYHLTHFFIACNIFSLFIFQFLPASWRVIDTWLDDNTWLNDNQSVYSPGLMTTNQSIYQAQ